VSVAQGAEIRAFSHLEGCDVGPGAIIGPYARLRPGAKIGAAAHIGNFVEVKAAAIGAGAKANHLSYIGDADIGAATNIGAGFITCNYDGKKKHKTTIGKNAFIGSNVAMVAPVTVGDEALIAAGSVITEEVQPGTMAIARSRQIIKPKKGS
jgi:bifunctional UDP-N-acetylglucosamine pyrophosphorylase/glucosamine-1-phosphate N-acetyltransferase